MQAVIRMANGIPSPSPTLSEIESSGEEEGDDDCGVIVGSVVGLEGVAAAGACSEVDDMEVEASLLLLVVLVELVVLVNGVLVNLSGPEPPTGG